MVDFRVFGKRYVNVVRERERIGFGSRVAGSGVGVGYELARVHPPSVNSCSLLLPS